MAEGGETGFEIGTAGSGDVEDVLALWSGAAARPTPTDGPGPLLALLDRDPGALLLAREPGGGLIGTLIAAWDGWRGSFYRLAVDPAWRRRGVASSLLRAGEQRLARLGARRLTAIVETEERAAIEFWAALGYERQVGRGRFVKPVQPTAH